MLDPSSAERNVNSSIYKIQPGKQMGGMISDRKQHVQDSGRGLLEDYSISDSLVDYSMPSY